MKHNPKRLWRYILLIFIVVLIYLLLNHFIFKPPSFEAQLLKMAARLNENCPMMVDHDTRLDNAMGGPGKYFTYNYTFINHDAAQLNIVDLKQTMIPVLTNYINTSEDMQIFRREKVTLKYNYRDKQGVFLFSITIRPEDYKR